MDAQRGRLGEEGRQARFGFLCSPRESQPSVGVARPSLQRAFRLRVEAGIGTEVFIPASRVTPFLATVHSLSLGLHTID